MAGRPVIHQTGFLSGSLSFSQRGKLPFWELGQGKFIGTRNKASPDSALSRPEILEHRVGGRGQERATLASGLGGARWCRERSLGGYTSGPERPLSSLLSPGSWVRWFAAEETYPLEFCGSDASDRSHILYRANSVTRRWKREYVVLHVLCSAMQR